MIKSPLHVSLGDVCLLGTLGGEEPHAHFVERLVGHRVGIAEWHAELPGEQGFKLVNERRQIVALAGSRYAYQRDDMLLGRGEEGGELGVTVRAGVFIAAHAVRVNGQPVAVVILRGESQHGIFTEYRVSQQIGVARDAHDFLGFEEFPAAGAAERFQRLAFLRLHYRCHASRIAGECSDAEYIPQVEGTVLQSLESGQHIIRQLGRNKR